MADDWHDHPLGNDEDPVAWARSETIAFTRKKVKRYSRLAAINGVAVVFFLKGMPGHALWHLFGIPLLILFACFCVPTLYFGAMLLGELLDK